MAVNTNFDLGVDINLSQSSCVDNSTVVGEQKSPSGMFTKYSEIFGNCSFTNCEFKLS